MNWPLTLSIAAIIVGPLTGLLVALIANHRSKKVDDSKLVIDRSNSNNELIQTLMEGFTEQIKTVTQANKDLSKKVDTLETKNAELERRLNERDVVKAAMLQHILELEALVPNPPGPPARKFQ
jgi:cell shape-determining protein MreC